MKTKKIFLIILVFSIVNTAHARLNKKFDSRNFHLKQDTLVQYLSSLNLLQFMGNPIDSFLARIPLNYDTIRILPGDQMKKAHMLYLKYSNGVTIEIYVKHFRNMNPDPPISNWNITLFRKEELDHIEIYQGVTCLNGCNY